MTKSNPETIRARFFTWRLRQREGVYFADGRANSTNLGRHSLGTRKREEALDALNELDSIKAVEFGLITEEELAPRSAQTLNLEEGQRLYLESVGCNRVAYGVRPSTIKRYRTVFEKFLVFAMGLQLETWNAVNKQTLLGYMDYLENEKGRAFRTIYFELTILKQAIGWMVKEKLLPANAKIDLRLRKPSGTDTYCWRMDEFRAMLEFCQAHPELAWLHEIILALGLTGMRISELLDLRWSNIDLENEVICLVDETASSKKRSQPELRTLKGARDRAFPIHEELLTILRSRSTQTGRVFESPRGVPRKQDAIRNIFKRDVVKPLASEFPTAEGEMGFEKGRFHSFRHFFCSFCANRGVPMHVVMTWLGHTESKMVMHYYHLHDEEARRQMRRLQLFDKENGDVSE